MGKKLDKEIEKEEEFLKIKKSIAPSFRIGWVLFFWLIVPTVLLLVDILKRKKYSAFLYNNYVEIKSGVLNKLEERREIYGTSSIDVYQNFWGRIFHYGNVYIKTDGENKDILLTEVKHPEKIKAFAIRYITEKKEIAKVVRV